MKKQMIATYLLAGLSGFTLWGSEPFDVEDGRTPSNPFQSAAALLSPDDFVKLRALSAQEKTALEHIVGVETQDGAGRLLSALFALDIEKMKLVLAHPTIYGALLKEAPHWLQALNPDTLEAARVKHLGKNVASPRRLQPFYGELSGSYLTADYQRKLVIALTSFVMFMIIHRLCV